MRHLVGKLKTKYNKIILIYFENQKFFIFTFFTCFPTTHLCIHLEFSTCTHNFKWLLWNGNQVLNVVFKNFWCTNINYHQICLERDNKSDMRAKNLPLWPHEYLTLDMYLLTSKQQISCYNILFHFFLLFTYQYLYLSTYNPRMENANTSAYLQSILETVERQLDLLDGAPSVQMHDVPDSFFKNR